MAMLAHESKDNGKTGGSYGLPRRRGGRTQFGLFLYMRFKLLTVRFFFLCRFRVADSSISIVLQICDVQHESHHDRWVRMSLYG